MEEILLTIIENNENLSSQLTSTMQKFAHYIVEKETTNGVLEFPNEEKFYLDDDNAFVGGSIFFDKFSEENIEDVCVELYDADTNEYIDTIGFDELDLKTQYEITKSLFDYYV